jgi:hypothetical protein
MHFCFVSTRRGSHFMTELLSAISTATAASGHSVEVTFDRFPTAREECIYVVIPHEFRVWGDPQGFPGSEQLERTIALCTENLGTEWFEATYELVPKFAAAISINRSSAAELRRRGIRCEHIQLGYSPLWDTWQREEDVERPIDVLYLGAADPRRDPLVAGFGRDLWAHECQFLIPPLEPRTRPRPDFLKEADKYHRLRSAKILLNLHRTTSAALEWMRFLEAICNGCVVVSEPCLDGDPLVVGQHFLEATAEDITQVVNRLLDDPQRLQGLREQAYDFVRDKLPMEPAGYRLAELAAELPRRPPATRHATRVDGRETITRPSPHTPATGGEPPDLEAPLGTGESEAPAEVPTTSKPWRAITRHVLGTRQHKLQTLVQTSAYASAVPRVTVCVVARGRGSNEDVLASVAASQSDDLELLVLDDASQDGFASAAGRVLEAQAALPAMLLQRSVSRGLGDALNVLSERARGQYIFVLDGDAGIYPSTLERLADALELDARATFSYPMVAVFAAGNEAVELRSSLPWEPQRLRRASWIDSMALLRRDRLLKLGGYTTDPQLAGWEHFELWCRCAEAGGHGVQVPQVLAWRHRNADTVPPGVWTVLRARFPQLLVAPISE